MTKKGGRRERVENEPYDPFARKNLAESMARALEGHPEHRLDEKELPMFTGSGIYVFYYLGDFPLYRAMAHRNKRACEIPIYVGRSDGGRRTGREPTECPLRGRVMDHRGSLREATNLSLSDFRYRYLVTDPIWVPLGEYALTNRWKPLWNTVVDGFGNNAAGAGREETTKSRWDTLHPGRKRAKKFKDRLESIADIEAFVRVHLAHSVETPPTPIEGDKVMLPPTPNNEVTEI